MADNLVKALSQENLRQIINILMTMNKSDESTGVKVYTNGEEYLKDDNLDKIAKDKTEKDKIVKDKISKDKKEIKDKKEKTAKKEEVKNEK